MLFLLCVTLGQAQEVPLPEPPVVSSVEPVEEELHLPPLSEKGALLCFAGVVSVTAAGITGGQAQSRYDRLFLPYGSQAAFRRDRLAYQFEKAVFYSLTGLSVSLFVAGPVLILIDPSDAVSQTPMIKGTGHF